MAISYDRNTDYQKKINQAAAIGDNTAAAVYEAQRNAKIQGEGLTGVRQTNQYANYLPDESVVRSITRQEQSPGIAQTVQRATTYQNPYQKQLDQLVNDYTKSTFSYNQDTDPAAQAYRESYTRNGQLAMQDATAQAAARTGGLASSYAGQVGQQAYNSYLSDLNAQLAGLRQQAYENYLSDQSLQQNRINTVAGLGQQAESSYYNRINDAMNRWATLGYADDAVAGVLGVAAGTPTTDQSYQTWSQNFQQAQQDQAVADANRAYANDLVNQMLQAGLTPEAATLQTAGISAADAAALRDFYKQQLAKAGGSGAAGGYGAENAAPVDVQRIEIPQNAYSDYGAAKAYLQSVGAPKALLDGLLTREVWTQEKGEPDATGRGRTASTEDYDYYEDYLYGAIHSILGNMAGWNA